MKEKKKKGKLAGWTLWLNLLSMLLLLVALIFGVKWWLQSYTHHGEGIEVPDLYGMDYRRAMDLLEERGLNIMASDSTYIKEMPAGSVVVQSPAKGMEVKSGRTVYVTINSLTIPRVRIPDLIENSSYREAEARLRQLEFRLLPPKLIDGEKDWVYGIQLDGRSLRTGDMVARESQLMLVIGSGTYGDDYNDEFHGDDLPANQQQDDDGIQLDFDDVDDFEPINFDDEE